MASLVDQILAQSTAASANGQGFGEFFMKGRDQAQRQEAINLEKQQLAMQLAQLPLKQTLMQQDAQMNSLKLTDLLEQRQLLIKNEGALQEAYNLAGQALASGNPEDAEGYVMDTISRTLGATRDPRFQQLLKDVRESSTAKMQLQALRTQNRLVAPTAAIQNSERMDTLQQAYDAAVASGDPVLIADAKRKLDNFSTIVSPTTETIYDVATGRPILERGPRRTGAGGLPASSISRAEDSIVGAANAARMSSKLVTTLRPEDIGILGRGGEIIVDEGLAQAVPSLANLKRVDNRTLLRMFRSDFVKALRQGDSQMSDEDRRRIEAMLPSEGSNESLPSAIQKIKTATREAADRSRMAAQRTGRPIPDVLLTPNELLEKVRRGELTPEQASAIARQSPYRDDFDSMLKGK